MHTVLNNSEEIRRMINMINEYSDKPVGFDDWSHLEKIVWILKNHYDYHDNDEANDTAIEIMKEFYHSSIYQKAREIIHSKD